MDTTTAWWLCPECDVEAELPAQDVAGTLVPCPDCSGAMTEHWYLSSAA
jgi:uncharacterized paraquat-inducible protein A